MIAQDQAEYRHRLRQLASFQHRGSATSYETQAADYLIGELRDCGLNPMKQPFTGCSSWGARHLIHVAVAAISLGFLWYVPSLTAVIAALAALSFWAEGTSLRKWLSRPLVQSSSANVVVHLPSTTDVFLRVIVCGHYDSQRTGLIWRLAGRLAPIQWHTPIALKPPLQPILLAMIAQIVLGMWAMSGTGTLQTFAACVLFAVYAVYGALFLQWAIGRFVPGAADNASGAAAVVSIGQAWARDPGPGVEVVLLLTGCEESGLLGASAWADARTPAERDIPTLFLNLDCLGMGPTRFLGWEVPVVGMPVPYPASILSIAAKIANEQGLKDAGPHVVPGPTDGLALLNRGIPGITIAGFEGHGHFPNYHLMSDTADNVDYDSGFRGVSFAWELLKALAVENLVRSELSG